MRILGVAYALAGCLLFFFPKEVFYLMNVGPRIAPGSGLLAIPDPSESFWLVLATSMTAMLSALSFLAAETPKSRGYALVHVLSKAVSVAGFAYVFLHQARYFAYLVGVAIELPIALAVTFAYLRASRAPRAPRAEDRLPTEPSIPPRTL